jgi:hypothetical protein
VCVKLFQALPASRAHRFMVYKLDNDLTQVVVDKWAASNPLAVLLGHNSSYAVYNLEFVTVIPSTTCLAPSVSASPGPLRPRT